VEIWDSSVAHTGLLAYSADALHLSAIGRGNRNENFFRVVALNHQFNRVHRTHNRDAMNLCPTFESIVIETGDGIEFGSQHFVYQKACGFSCACNDHPTFLLYG